MDKLWWLIPYGLISVVAFSIIAPTIADELITDSLKDDWHTWAFVGVFATLVALGWPILVVAVLLGALTRAMVQR